MYGAAVPMREPTFNILLALAREERHGYGVIQHVIDLTDGAVKLGPGTLYGALDRLTSEGLVVESRVEVVDGRERRYYRLTDDGRGELAAEVARRAAVVDVAQRELGVVGVEGARP
jgi:DNA-binding PadR family transcriptional regulator